MATEQTATCVCRRCKKSVPFHYESVNHFEQLCLTVVTLGIWLPFWIAAARTKTKVCDVCKNPLSDEQ